MLARRATGEIVGQRFFIEREVGRGAVGTVYRAVDQVTSRPVALKIIAVAGVDDGEHARFQREGRLLAGLHHPGIVGLVAFGSLENADPYVAMEWLDGEDIAQRHKRAPLSMPLALDVAAQVADALEAAHRAGIVHRDVKPSNVVLTGDPGSPTAKLVDFGVASGGDARLTKTGAIIGTPAYMAPEQARGDTEPDARSDIYSLGATLFEMIAKRPPHVGPTPVAVLARLVTTTAPRLSELAADIPEELDEFVAGMLRTSAADRPPTAAEVATALRRMRVALERGETETAEPKARQSVLPTPGGTRVITSILATRVPKGAVRTRLLAYFRARGGDAHEIGGDAIVVHLGLIHATGDEATRALDFAQRLAKANASVGVASGRSRIDRARPSGQVVDRAAALARDAERGEILVDAPTMDIARAYAFKLRPDGSGILGEAPANRREGAATPFVGREAEMAQLEATYERSVDERRPTVFTVSGTPGLGKSRILRETLSRLNVHPSSPRIVPVRCDPFAKEQPLGGVAELIRALVGVPRGSDPQAAESAISAFRTSLGEAEPLDPFALDLVGKLLANEQLPTLADARAARDALWVTLTDLALLPTTKRPLVLALEDAHSADTESITWFDHLLGQAEGRPLFLLCAMRPSFWREGQDRFRGRELVRLDLRPLSRKNSRTIVLALLGERAEAAEGLADSIADQSGGSPLFAEELARLAARGQDARSATTIEAAMQVHLDALDDVARDAAHRLSVFGLTGWDRGLESLGVTNATDVLRSLSAADIVQEQANSTFKGTRQFAFKHAIMREVSYASLGDEALRDCHARAGKWLGTQGAEDATVARHLELAGDSELAATYLERAARRALAAHALSSAVEMAERSLAFALDKATSFSRAQLLDESWSRLDAGAGERETAVSAMESSVYDAGSEIRARGARLRFEDARGGSVNTSKELNSVRERAKVAHLRDEEARCAAALASRHAFAGEFALAERVIEELLALSHEPGLMSAAVDAWQTRAVISQARGDVGAALDARRSAVSVAREAGLKAREAALNINVGFALTTLGARSESRTSIEQGIALAKAIGSPGTVRHGQMILLCWTATFGSDADADRLLEEPRNTADAALSGSWVPHDRATLGVLFYRGAELLRDCRHASTTKRESAERARTLLRIAARGYQATTMLDVVPVALGILAESELLAGDPDEAIRLSQDGARLVEGGSPSLLNEAPIFLTLHDAMLEKGDARGAREAVARGLPRLRKRMEGLAGTPYLHDFVWQIEQNSALLKRAREYGLSVGEMPAVRS